MPPKEGLPTQSPSGRSSDSNGSAPLSVVRRARLAGRIPYHLRRAHPDEVRILMALLHFKISNDNSFSASQEKQMSR